MQMRGWTRVMASLVTGLAFSLPVHAAKPAVDSFSAGGNSAHASTSFPTTTQGSFPAASNKSNNAVQWFEKLDEAIATHRVTAAEQVILSRSFNQEVERVQEWSTIAAAVAKRYRALVAILKAMPVPAGFPGTQEYRDLNADWYNDAAGIYEDLIKPRLPAKTVEELDAGLQEIKARAEGLAQTSKNLKNMDMSLRRSYRVHMPRYDDALQQYVRTK